MPQRICPTCLKLPLVGSHLLRVLSLALQLLFTSLPQRKQFCARHFLSHWEGRRHLHTTPIRWGYLYLLCPVPHKNKVFSLPHQRKKNTFYFVSLHYNIVNTSSVIRPTLKHFTDQRCRYLSVLTSNLWHRYQSTPVHLNDLRQSTGRAEPQTRRESSLWALTHLRQHSSPCTFPLTRLIYKCRNKKNILKRRVATKQVPRKDCSQLLCGF